MIMNESGEESYNDDGISNELGAMQNKTKEMK
jgi:hypothetical protein